MTSFSFEFGDVVKASYKSGEYIGQIAEQPGIRKVAVSVKAILKHPTQGDLHHPMDAQVPFFHQRRALAENEIALMPLESIEKFLGEIPLYRNSLLQSLENEIVEMNKLLTNPTYADWASKCLAELSQLKQEYHFE